MTLAIRNGLTLECGECFQHLRKAIDLGLVTEREFDALVARMLLCRLRLGTLGNDPACPYNEVDPSCLCSEAHHALARKMARESMVLLKNNGVLPLNPDRGFYSVSGADSSDVFPLLGNYYGVSARMTTFLEGIVGVVGPGVCVSYVPGYFYGGAKSTASPWPWTEDVSIVVIGLNGAYEGEEGADVQLAVGHGRGDRTDLKLPTVQMDHLRKVAKGREKGKKVVVVLTGGSPVELAEIESLADAVVMAWYAGEVSGEALGELIFGKADFTGRLPPRRSPRG